LDGEATFSRAKHSADQSTTYERSMNGQSEIVLYRMVLPEHVCPFGLLAKRMLEDARLPFEDKLLTSREEVEAFKAEHGVATTPQAFVNGERVGGSEELARFLQTADAQS
jgi:glutaredoxin 3